VGSTAGLAPGFKESVEQLLELAGGRVSVTSGFRTYDEQVAARRRNGCPDIYRSPASACRVPTAIPGTSKHEKGAAVDFGGDLALADRLAARVGLTRTVPGEPWHFESTNGRVVSSIAAAGQPDDDGGLVDGIVRSLRNLTVTGMILMGGAALVVMGGYRAVTGRSLAAAVGKAGGQAALAGATGGASKAASAAKRRPSTADASRRTRGHR
jgi:hypothetical protein